MSNLQPPRPGGMSGAPRPGGPNGPTPAGGPGGARRKLPSGPKINAPSERALLLVFLGLVLMTCVSVYLMESPLTHHSATIGMWIGSLLGLFGCTITFGFYRFMVNQQYAANKFSEWNFPISRGRLAQIATLIGWAAGAVNCYLIAYEFARRVA